MTIPTLWHPGENPKVWDRAFRVEIENGLNQVPVLNGHIERTYDIEGEKVTKYMPQMELSAGMDALLADPETAGYAKAIIDATVPLLYILWQRKIAQAGEA